MRRIISIFSFIIVIFCNNCTYQIIRNDSYIDRVNEILKNQSQLKNESSENRLYQEEMLKEFDIKLKSFSKDDIFLAPSLLYYIKPKYPAKGLKEKLTGKILVGIIVDEHGKVAGEKILSSSNIIFEKPTIEALKQWKFNPAKVNGESIKFLCYIPIVFQLK